MSVSSHRPDKKYQPGSPEWKSFNASFANLELTPIQIADAIANRHPFTTWHKNKWRLGANFLCGQHLALDFDAGDKTSSLTALQNDPIIAKHAALLYTTPSHQPEAPRTRALFLLDTPIMQATNYVAAAEALLFMYGTADAKCKDPARFFYGAGMTSELVFLHNVLPLDKVKEYIRTHAAHKAETARPRQEWEGAPPEMSEVESALRSIPPLLIPYDQWLNILMALHREFGYAALPMAEAWGQGKPNEIRDKWRSFHENGNTTGTITIATLFKIAAENGWSRPL